MTWNGKCLRLLASLRFDFCDQFCRRDELLVQKRIGSGDDKGLTAGSVSEKARHNCRETASKEVPGSILGNTDQFYELQAVRNSFGGIRMKSAATRLPHGPTLHRGSFPRD